METERHDLLKQAQNLIRIWTNEKYISIYFEKCVQEKERKDFWLKYIKEIERIRIVGSEEIKMKLNADTRLRQILQGKFILSSSNAMSEMSAIIMKIRDKVYIEFSTIGNALFVYEIEHLPIKQLFSRSCIWKVTDLKQTDLNMLIELTKYGTYDNEYGRLFHKGEWQYRLSNYISRH